MITYVLLSDDCYYNINLTWSKNETKCTVERYERFVNPNIETDAWVFNSRVQSIEKDLCPVFVAGYVLYFGGCAYKIKKSRVYKNGRDTGMYWRDLSDAVNSWMESKRIKITPADNVFCLAVGDQISVRGIDREKIRHEYFFTINFDLELPVYDKPLDFYIPENEGRVIPYCRNKFELYRALRHINKYGETGRDRPLSKLYQKILDYAEILSGEIFD